MSPPVRGPATVRGAAPGALFGGTGRPLGGGPIIIIIIIIIMILMIIIVIVITLRLVINK